jgi:predicted metal-binding protein
MIAMLLERKLIEEAISAGAAKAVVILQEQIVLSATFRDICAGNACGKYGLCYMCPPDVGDIEQLMETVRRYPRALVYQTISPLEDSFDYEGMTDAGFKHVQLSQRLQDKLTDLLPQGFLHLTCGGCRLCETCGKAEGRPCRYPDRALPSVASYGIDVYNTVKDTELKYINGPNTVTFFAMALYVPEEASLG